MVGATTDSLAETPGTPLTSGFVPTALTGISPTSGTTSLPTTSKPLTACSMRFAAAFDHLAE
jgi:hypothetical protein